ncbi:hypothetical protein SAMN05443663_102349 [Flavobacterium defluvii]|uniref:Uncharacterized protein n=1 Tax=Flavobacterium defluvii TaxID=370979 RepID=A0A1M5IC05_9FLAO|nr:hypothetical protein SAMN05443663_102349 [Flavobacterium defluvii]
MNFKKSFIIHGYKQKTPAFSTGVLRTLKKSEIYFTSWF